MPTAVDSGVVDDIINTVMQQVLRAISDKASVPSSSSNFAGTLHSFQASAIPINALFANWIIDTGASDHMTSNIDLLHDICYLSKPLMVGLPDGRIKLVYQTGTVFLTPDITLKNVLLVPDFKQNLLSVGRLIDNTNLCVIFYPHMCLFQDLSSKVTLGTGHKIGDLYKFQGIQHTNLRSKVATAVYNALGLRSDASFCSISSTYSCAKGLDFALLHARLGHTSVEKLRHLSAIKMSPTHDFSCETCILAKHRKLPFYKSASYALHCFELFHMDIWGPYKIPTYTGARFFLTILDDHSRTTWTFLFQTKSQVPKLIQNFL
ncbi:hypothetical protein RND81_13G130700 [Saponaria officinalis]|uniref:GAG-pre-integrase domain-containing protein n=1 Tax=Saponaria officinalis TaxID=3572 RepID=A0AAW1GXF7_SAPOF